MAELPPRPEGIALCHFIVSDDVERSKRFYTEVLGGRLVYSGPGGLTYVALANSWIIINVGGGPTDDKPDVNLDTPGDPHHVSAFLNIRVADVHAIYAEWKARGADFLTEPKQHQYEIRCYIRDPDGHLIEVGQTTDPGGDWHPEHWPSSTAAEELGRDIDGGVVVTTAIIGTGGIGSAIAGRLAAGGEHLRLASADPQSARTLAATLGDAAVVADGNRGVLQGADAVILALRFPVVHDVIAEIADDLGDRSLVIPSNPVGLDSTGRVVRLLPEGQSSGLTMAGWSPPGTRLALTFGTMSADLLVSSSHRTPDSAVLFYVTDDDAGRDEVERLIRTAGFEPVKLGGLDQSSRLEVGGDLHDRVVGLAEARSLVGGA